jgi:ABC-type proline/glycine betaine transport system ATPase subunit
MNAREDAGPAVPTSAIRGAAVEFRRVSKTYAGSDRDGGKAPAAVVDLSCTVPSGEFCVLVGPSGCGKMTTLKMVNRLIAPTSGQILILHRRLGKTVIFVTHDVDEAIKLGSRVAVDAQSGHLVQYSRPAEVLTRPASEYVARFVGADRGPGFSWYQRKDDTACLGTARISIKSTR